MTQSRIITLELMGLAMVLLSAGWEFFVERTLTDISQDAKFYRVERKLDELWWQVGAIRTQVDPDPKYALRVQSYAEASERWSYAGYPAEFEGLLRQTAFAKRLRSIGFLFGSVLLLVARGFDLFSKEHNEPITGRQRPVKLTARRYSRKRRLGQPWKRRMYSR